MTNRIKGPRATSNPTERKFSFPKKINLVKKQTYFPTAFRALLHVWNFI